MIYVEGRPLDTTAMISEYPQDSIERKIIDILSSSGNQYAYDSLRQLKFELKLRREIVNAAYALQNSRVSFSVFRKSECNPEFWVRRRDGGFVLKEGVKPSDAIRDIFKNGQKYKTECATAMLIVYYKALLETFPEDAYNKIFNKIILMNWHQIASELQEVGLLHTPKDFLPGDRLYFANPDVDPVTPEWQGENVIDLGNGTYYGHGIGIYTADLFIKALNMNRKEDADESAYLTDYAARPDFKNLSDLYDKYASS